jgi:UDP:flavonoid glycosyltransferase YjiC (YdhE family)
MPGHDMTRRETDLVRDWEPINPIEGAERFRDGVLFGPALENAKEVIAVIDRWPADAIVLDWLLFGTALAAEKAGVPSVALVHLPYPMRTSDAADLFFAPGLATMNRARTYFGLDPVLRWDQQLLNTDAVFMLTAPELDPAATLDLPDNVHYVGPALEAAAQEWTSPWPAFNENPLVLISFSTTFMDQQDLARRVLRAVEDLPVRALLTTGPALTLEGIAVPDNARVSAFVPHGAVLPQAALAITHGGFGTIQAALSAGVPLICIPTARDQPANAARIAELGLGLSLPAAASADAIRAAVVTTLKDQQFRARTALMSKVLNRDDGAAAVVDYLEMGR